MKIKVNCEYQEIAEGLSLADLLSDMTQGGAATALNGRFIPKDSRSSAFLNEGDEVTIISAAYGG